MAKTQKREGTDAIKRCERDWRRELLQEAMMGAVPADQCLERMLDHLERTP
ncbi:hypothetical protein [uncultured Tateyamaria sp.]|uniref:hypothetical protein n=1 Tax=uncultured Tateyamaria sp. TaxID=455651 RepID=UPI00260FC042|nr:hypothetical protein [uncultured Tateyamaria sp.]